MNADAAFRIVEIAFQRAPDDDARAKVLASWMAGFIFSKNDAPPSARAVAPKEPEPLPPPPPPKPDPAAKLGQTRKRVLDAIRAAAREGGTARLPALVRATGLPAEDVTKALDGMMLDGSIVAEGTGQQKSFFLTMKDK
ncbi:hypothetical protein WCLP8_4930004 [uncultured Gammaproteobacteria bacterium]